MTAAGRGSAFAPRPLPAPGTQIAVLGACTCNRGVRRGGNGPIRRWTGLGPQDAEGRRPAFTARRTVIAFSAPQNPRSADRPKSLTDSGPVKPSMQGPLNPEMPRPRPVNATLPPGKATPPPRKRRDPRPGYPGRGSCCGGQRQDRTVDLPLFRRTLYRLSYRAATLTLSLIHI